jgi:hypothetical protein
MIRPIVCAPACAAAAPALLSGQVTFDRLLRADQEPHNWQIYSGSYNSQGK